MENFLPYHVFRKPRKSKKGKTVHRWYYYWLDVDGKQIQRSCRGCKNRSEAENYIRSLPPPPGAPTVSGPDVRIRDIAETMYIPGGDHIHRRKQLGKSINPGTMRECRIYIKKIVSLWGDMKLGGLGVDTVMPYLFNVDRSGGWKNRFLEVLGEIYSEAPWYNCRVSKPAFQCFATNYHKADIFSTEELDRLFKPENFISYQFYLFFLLCLSAGMRLGEVRAVRAKQIIADKKIIIIDGFCKVDGTRTVYNKTGNPDNPRFRIVYLPDITLAKMKAWIKKNGLEPEDFCFTYAGQPIKTEYAELAFSRSLQAAGFMSSEGQEKGRRRRPKSIDGRRLVPHSLRYTYVSRMRRELTAAELLPMTGHSSEVQVDYYNRKVLDLALASLPKVGAAVANTIFK